jgi:hypothetical protein
VRFFALVDWLVLEALKKKSYKYIFEYLWANLKSNGTDTAWMK